MNKFSLILCLAFMINKATSQFKSCDPMNILNDPISAQERLPYTIRVFPTEDGKQQRVQVAGKLFQHLFVEARDTENTPSPLVGKWLSEDLPIGHRVVTCEGANQSSISSGRDFSQKAQVTYTWIGECTENVSFFIYVGSGGNWKHTVVPCHVVTSEDGQNIKDYSEWSEFSECSRTCGEGFQTRRRNCIRESNCENTIDRQACNIKDCIKPKDCTDGFLRCDPWGKMGLCQSSFGTWMKKSCPRTCRVCVRDDENVGEKVCADNGKYQQSCQRWAASGKCTHPLWMKYVQEKCPASCRLCDK